MSELSDQGLLALKYVSCDFLALIKLNDVLLIVLESDQNVAWPFCLHDLDLVLQDSSLFDNVLEPEEGFFVTEVNVDFVSVFSAENMLNLLFFDYFCWQLVIVFDKIFRLVN